MKLFSVTFALFLLSAIAGARSQNPHDETCNRPENLAKVEAAVVRDVRARVQAEAKEAAAASFHFTNVLHHDQQADLTVYFERIIPGTDHVGTRRGMIAQYSVTEDACVPEFKTMQALTPASAPFPAFASTPADVCDDALSLSKIHSRVVASLDFLYRQIDPESQLTNFAYTSISRVDGTANLVGLFEVSRPGFATQPSVVKISVDPKTCEARYVASSPFGWLLISY